MKTFFASLFLLGIVPAILVALGFACYCVNPVSTQKTGKVVIEIIPGSSLRTIASILEEAHAIRGKWRFKLLAKLVRVERRLKYGEYRFTLPQPPLAILRELASGNVTAYFVTFPEGSTMFDVARHIENAGLCSADAILEKAADRAFARALNIDGESLEGYLFPETYKFNRGSTPEVILKRMVEQFHKVVTHDMEHQARAMGLTRKEFITLASLVEKETGREEERAVIAAVFLNRLKKGMRLDCDPTVIYGLKLEDNSFHERLHKKHLKQEGPYNTYLNSGLPPGPICNPGLKSISAVLNPAQVNYFYFVSKNDGTHQFSETLAEHNRAVNTYQRQN